MQPAAGHSANEAKADLAQLLGEAILSTRSDAIVAADREGIIRIWNPGAERVFGHTRDEALGRTLDLIIPERLRARHWEGFARVVETGQSRYREDELLAVPAMRKNGTAISVQFTIAPIRKSGQMIGMAAIIRDVTKQFQETRELRRRLAELQARIAGGS